MPLKLIIPLGAKAPVVVIVPVPVLIKDPVKNIVPVPVDVPGLKSMVPPVCVKLDDVPEIISVGFAPAGKVLFAQKLKVVPVPIEKFDEDPVKFSATLSGEVVAGGTFVMLKTPPVFILKFPAILT